MIEIIEQVLNIVEIEVEKGDRDRERKINRAGSNKRRPFLAVGPSKLARPNRTSDLYRILAQLFRRANDPQPEATHWRTRGDRSIPSQEEKLRPATRGKMGKTPVRMKAVVYALSPFQQKVMPGLWKDITTKIHHKVTENWISATLLLTPVVGTYQ